MVIVLPSFTKWGKTVNTTKDGKLFILPTELLILYGLIDRNA